MSRLAPNDRAERRYMLDLLGIIDSDQPGDVHDCSGCWDAFADDHDGPLLDVDADTLRSRFLRWHDSNYPPHPRRDLFAAQYVAWMNGRRRDSPTVWSIGG